MGLFSKKPGGTFFGNLWRGAGKIVGGLAGLVGSPITPQDLGIATGANKIEKGQKFTNKDISNNPDLYVPPGESYTIAELKKNPGLAQTATWGQYTNPSNIQIGYDGGGAIEPAPTPKVPVLQKVTDFFNNLGGAAAGANVTADNTAKMSKLLHVVLIAGLAIVGIMFFNRVLSPRRGRR